MIERGMGYFLEIGLTVTGFTLAGLMIFASGIVEESFIYLSSFMGLILSTSVCVLDELGYRKEQNEYSIKNRKGEKIKHDI